MPQTTPSREAVAPEADVPVLPGSCTWRLLLGAGLIGAVSAFAAACVRLGFRGLQWALTGSAADPPAAAGHLAPLRRVITPFVGAALASLVLLLRAPLARWLGRDPVQYVEYVEAVRREDGEIPFFANLWRTLSAAFSVASGAAVGREGSMIQFAAATASAVARRLGLSAAQGSLLPFLVACGVAGGVTTAYNAPVAGVFFALEIVLGAFSWAALPPLALASAVAWLVGGSILGRERLYPMPAVPWHLDRELLLLGGMAVLGGLLSPAYQWLLGCLRSARRLPAALLWSGVVTGSLSVLDPRVWGNGDAGLRSALGIAPLPPGATTSASLAHLLVLRLSATLACMWTGVVGGVFTPTLYAGASLGALAGPLLPASRAGDPLLAVAGMSLFLAAVTHAPLMAAAMAVELTGEWALLPLLLALNYLATAVSRSLSPRALYSIASQTPRSVALPPKR